MNLTELKDCINPNALCETVLLSKISKTLEACEQAKDLMIGIYLIEKEHFLFSTRSLKHILGNRRLKLLEKGWDFWLSRIDPSESRVVKNQLNTFFKTPFIRHNLSLRYHIRNMHNKSICIRHELVLRKMEGHTLALNYFFDVSVKEKIEKLFSTPKETLKSVEHDPRVSAREKEVFHLIANGFSSKEIANKLFISNHTAISHRKNLIEKFHVKNTAHLVKKAGLYIGL